MKKSNNDGYVTGRKSNGHIKKVFVIVLKTIPLLLLLTGLGLAVCVAFGLFQQSGAAVVLSLVAVFIALMFLFLQEVYILLMK